jgi:site-specific DNA recombinase
LDQYRATLDAGADPATVARWITETEAERAKYQALKRAAPPQATLAMSREEVASVVSALSDLLIVLRSADPADKAEIYTRSPAGGPAADIPTGRGPSYPS